MLVNTWNLPALHTLPVLLTDSSIGTVMVAEIILTPVTRIKPWTPGKQRYTWTKKQNYKRTPEQKYEIWTCMRTYQFICNLTNQNRAWQLIKSVPCTGYHPSKFPLTNPVPKQIWSHTTQTSHESFYTGSCLRWKLTCRFCLLYGQIPGSHDILRRSYSIYSTGPSHNVYPQNQTGIWENNRTWKMNCC